MGEVSQDSTTLRWSEDDSVTNDAVQLLRNRLGADAERKLISLFVGELRGRVVVLRSRQGGMSGAFVFDAYPSKDGVPEEMLVVKIAASRKMDAEFSNFRNFVQRYLRTGSFAMVTASNEVPCAGDISEEKYRALFYRRIGTRSIDAVILACVKDGRLASACSYVDEMLSVLCAWQSSVRVVDNSALTSDSMFGFGPYADMDRFDEECQQIADELRGSYYDVLRFWRSSAVLAPQRTYITAVHGDLHHDNVRILDTGSVALIDYGACSEEGHFLRDLVTFEAHLVVRAFCPKGGIDNARTFYERIASQYNELLERDPFEMVSEVHILEPILHVRRYAYACLCKGSRELWAQYAFGLLRHMIRLVMRERGADGTGDIDEGQRWLAAQLACDISERLTIEDNCVSFGYMRDRFPGGNFGFLAPYGRLNDNGLPPLASIRPLPGEMWRYLASSLLKAQRLDIVGVSPWPLMKEMLSLASDDARRRKGRGGARGPIVRYVTTDQPTMSLARVTRWEDANKSMTNLVSILSGAMVENDLVTPPARMDTVVRWDPDVNDDCIIRGVWSGNRIHIVAVYGTRPRFVDEIYGYYLAEVSDCDGHLGLWLDILCASDRRPVRVHEVNCQTRIAGFEEANDAHNLRIPVASLAHFGSSSKSCLMPIALVVPRSRYFEGDPEPRVLMVKRDAMTDSDTWGRLSFPSARIRSQDLLDHKNRMSILDTFSGPEAEYEWLCQNVFGGSAWVGIDAIRRAGARALQERTGLEGTFSRLEYHGLITTEVQSEGRQSAYAVLTIDLSADEVDRAVRLSREMFNNAVELIVPRVRVKDLLNGTVEANRFIADYREWVGEHLFPEIWLSGSRQ